MKKLKVGLIAIAFGMSLMAATPLLASTPDADPQAQQGPPPGDSGPSALFIALLILTRMGVL